MVGLMEHGRVSSGQLGSVMNTSKHSSDMRGNDCTMRSRHLGLVLALICTLVRTNAQSPPGPEISRASGVFTNETVTFSITAASGVVRFTVDGRVPDEGSPAYSGPITVGTNVFIKARTFQPNLPPSEVVSRAYHFLDASAQAFTSGLPILLVNTSGQPIRENVPPGQLRVPGSLVVFNTVRGRSSLQSEPEFAGLAEFEIFGQTSSGYPNQPITIEIQDEFRNDRAVPLLGMPAEADWKLRSFYNDKTFLNEFLTFEMHELMGHYSVRRRFVEVFVDKSGGRVRYPQDYLGVMMLMEKIERGASRVNIAKLKPLDNAEPAITGGYIWKKDKDSVGDLNFSTAGGNGFAGQFLKIHEPKPREITTSQLNWLRNHLNEFERALYAANWLSATGAAHYSHFIDTGSFVDQHWIVEFTKNIDGYRLGNYMQKDRGGKIKMDLLWDWELSLGNADYLGGGKTNGWYWSLDGGGMGNAEHIWLRRLINGAPNVSPPSPFGGVGDPDFIQRIIDRWGELRTNAFSPARLLPRIDELAGQLAEATARDFAKTPRLGVYTWPNPNGPPNWDVDFVRPTTYLGVVNELKKFVSGRFAWIDSQFVHAPFFNHPGGSAAPGLSLSVAAPAGTIYYTLDGTDPRSSGGGIAAGVRIYSEPVVINENVRVFARARVGTGVYGWSPRAELFLVLATPPLRITEIMYRPAPISGSGFVAGEFEYVELRNVGDTTLPLAGFRLSGGVEFTFPNFTLAAGAHVLVVKNHAAFQAQYGMGLLIAGEFSGSLDDAGARLILDGPLSEPVLDFSYESGWHPMTDGHGCSLVIADDQIPRSAWGLATSWRASGSVNGSPGQFDSPPPGLPKVVINELLQHFESLPGAIELRNLSSGAADISGWFLTDNFREPQKYRVPDGTTIPAGGYRVFTEAEFNATPGDPASFTMSRFGGEACVFSADAAGTLTGYAQRSSFGPQREGVTWGRHVTGNGGELLVAQSANTLGGPNAGPRVGPVVISEIMYRPQDIAANGSFWDNTEEEFVELLNPSAAPVPLFDPAHPENRWRLGEGVEFEFAPATTLAAGERMLVVNFDPLAAPQQLQAFRNRHPLPPGTPVVGPYRGSLNNERASIALIMPDGPNAGVVLPVLVERVQYSARPPWSPAAAGIGFSLHRRDVNLYGDDPANWTASSPTPGANFVPGSPPVILVQPLNQTAITPSSVTFTVAAGGPGPHRYQWRRNGTHLRDATNLAFTIPTTRLADAGQYEVLVMNLSGWVESTTATLTVLQGVSIVEQPRSQSARAGSNATFVVSTLSTSLVRYQWRFHGTNLPGATNAMLVVTNVTDDVAGTYSVVCTDDLGSLNSQPAELLALTTPSLVAPAPPLHLAAVSGGTLTLGVQVNGKLPIYCRWRLFRPGGSGQILSDQLLTQRVSTITFPVTAGSAGAYAVILTNEVGGILGLALTNAVLTVLADSDGDLLPDDFETANGLRPNDPNDGSADADGDDASNRQEYLAGTDPQDAASFLKLEASNGAGLVELRFGAVSNRNYTLQFIEALPSARGLWRKLEDIVAHSTNRAVAVIDPSPGTNRYYRVVTPLQP